MPGPAQNIANIQAAWGTAKAKLAAVQADLAQLQSDLEAMEAQADLLYSYGAGDVVDWLRTHASQSVLGWQPRVSAGGNNAPQILGVWARQVSQGRDLTNVDQRPITTTPTGQLCQLT